MEFPATLHCTLAPSSSGACGGKCSSRTSPHSPTWRSTALAGALDGFKGDVVLEYFPALHAGAEPGRGTVEGDQARHVQRPARRHGGDAGADTGHAWQRGGQDRQDDPIFNTVTTSIRFQGRVRRRFGKVPVSAGNASWHKSNFLDLR